MGRKCTELPAFIIKRLPVRLVFDNNYFNDKYQGIPIGGYNVLIERLLDGADTRLGCDFFAHREELEALADKVVFTGAIDEYYGYRFGKLEYRTVRFEMETLDTPNYQAMRWWTIRNGKCLTHGSSSTSILRCSATDVDNCPKTVISREYSSEWTEGSEPYYPVNNEKNNALYLKYKELADKETNVIFGGRLAEYKYYDMHHIVEKVLNLF